MSNLRTTDVSYGPDYWNSLDGSRGYADSVMWQDIAHDLWEVFVVDWEEGEDRSGDHCVLDVGCAYGFLIRHLRSRGVETFGVDFSDYALEHAPDDVKPYLRNLDLRTGNDTFFGPDHFSIVTCLETMEHLSEEHVPNALGTMERAARPGGWVVLTICTEDQPGWDTDPTHVTIKSREWWLEQFAVTGLVHTPEKEDALRRFWLFSAHRGVFVFWKPTAT